MTYVVFETDGEIDIKSFTTFGINVKPNTDSPIGYFGTGLKYAIAILTRNDGDRVKVFIGEVEYEFYCKSQSFRGRDFDFIKMRKRKSLLSRWQYIELPFTTEFGKNWDMWQAFRELESNTRDEKGSTYAQEGDEVVGESGKTKIIISNEEFVDCYKRRDEIFLPTEDRDLLYSYDGVEVYQGESEHLYYRGLRVQKLENPSIYTYNFTKETDLTEDRTLKYYWYELGRIVSCIMHCNYPLIIENVISCDPDTNFEGGLDFDQSGSVASASFLSAVGNTVSSGGFLLPRVKTYYDNQFPELANKDPDVEITLKKNEWLLINDVLNNIDLYKMADSLGWEEEDEKFNPFIELRDKISKYEEQ